MEIVNQHLNYPKAELISPNTKGYIHIGAEVDSSPIPFYPFTSNKKKGIIDWARQILSELAKEEGVETISLFRAAIMPPAKQSYLESIKDSIHVAKFDIAILIETQDVERAKQLRGHEKVSQLIEYLKDNSSFTHAAVFENARRIAEVDKSREGVFLFNYFHAEDPSQLLPVWEYTAGWFTTNTGLDNSTLLMPAEGEESEYGVINHCRWDKLSTLLPKLMFDKTIRTYVAENFSANKIASMPILYRLVENYRAPQETGSA